MFRDSNWPLGPAFLIAKLLRKLAGNLDVPGMLLFALPIYHSHSREARQGRREMGQKVILYQGLSLPIVLYCSSRGDDHMLWTRQMKEVLTVGILPVYRCEGLAGLIRR